MLLPKARWVVQKANEQAVEKLATELKIEPLVATLLVNRGLIEPDEAAQFLFSEDSTFHDPYLFNDMEKTVTRIRSAIETGEPILIYGDYDADGVTSTTVLMETLLHLGANVNYYIPNRFTEGYGPNEEAFKKAHAQGVKLIITVDTGIAAIKEAKVAKELKMDLIITDHHEPAPELPEAYSIIHPRVPGSFYPFKDLAGVGVASKLAHALLGQLPESILELVAIGTIADLVPLHGENRSFVKAGLKQLTTSKRPGLQELCKIAGTSIAEINEETVGFVIAPRLNAVGRLDHAGPAVELLMTKDNECARQLADEIDLMNKERQQIVQKITNEAVQLVNQSYPPEKNKVIIVGKENWNPGVIGIVASKLVEKFYRPAIVLSYDHQTGLAKGSARSIPGFDLFTNLSANADLLPHFGGHTMAAGMTLHIDHVNDLRNRLNQLATEQLSERDFIPIVELDAVVDLKSITIDTIAQLDQLAPYGMNNPKPKVLIEHVKPSEIKKIGSNKNHLKLTFEADGYSVDSVGFNLGNLADEISPGAKLSAVGELAINEWNHIRKPQVFLKDLAVKEWQLFDLRGSRQLQHYLPQLPEDQTLFIFFSEIDVATAFSKKVIHDLEEAQSLNIDEKYIVLYDVPPSLELLEKLIAGKSPARIYVHFYQEQQQFFTVIPSRDHFKWYYAFLLKQGTFDVKKYGDALASRRGWTKETLIFMSKVFFDLNFVTIKDGLITINVQKTKKDLHESPTYQKKLAQINIEQELVYSSYQQLKSWFSDRLAHNVSIEEETRVWT